MSQATQTASPPAPVEKPLAPSGASRTRPRRLWVEGLRLAGLLGAVYCTWAAVYRKWTLQSFGEPIEYWLDAMFNLGAMKSASDFGLVPFLSKVNSRLGAPFSADWNDFPMSEDLTFFFWGMVARGVGVIAAMNLAFLASALAAAVCLYGVARWLRLRWEASLLAGALFGLSPFLFYRNIQHFTLINYWHLPLFIPVWLWVSSRPGLQRRSPRFKWALAIAALAGVQNVYFCNYFVLGVGLAILIQLFRRQVRKALAGAAVVGVALGAFLVMNADSLLHWRNAGKNPGAVVRHPAEIETYALRPIELFTPGPKHRIPAFARAGERRQAAALAIGEFPSPYLGLVGGIGLLALLVVTFRRVLVRSAPGWGRLGMYGLWFIAMTVIGGGLHVLQTVGGFALFRSNNRVSIVLLMLGLLFAARLLTALGRRLPGPLFAGLCLLLLVGGATEQSPSPVEDRHPPLWQKVPGFGRAARADRRLVEELERRLPQGSMVFQLPAMDFPETSGVGRVPDYDPMRPYLHSRHLRFSYGNMKGRPEANWHKEVAALPLPELLGDLERRGFAAIYLMKHAYGPGTLASILQGFRDAGRTEVIESDYGDSLAILLRPLAPAR